MKLEPSSSKDDAGVLVSWVMQMSKPSVKEQVDERANREWAGIQTPWIKQVEEQQNEASGFSRWSGKQ